MKILLVEDSATLRYAMRNYILEAGHTPLMASTGEEALQLLENTPVDMIIMDVEMPGLNGFETTRLIREWLAGHWIPIIFVTGRNEDEAYREGIDVGGDDYLIKPVSFMVLKAKIRAMERIADMRDQLNRLNAELEAISQLDSLTHIYNRRTFNELAAQQWGLANRQQYAISALMIDVDHFKLYNDHYGHPAGDTCLKQITQAIKSCLLRPSDLLGRYGGEEFVVLLPNSDTLGALRVAETIQDAIRHIHIKHDASPTDELVTVSVGGATCLRTTGHKLEELIKGADRALYKVKRAGRNRALVDEVACHKTVLIADHNTESVQHVSAMLQPHFNIVSCDSREECLEIALDVHPDLILLGTTMADTEDHTLCRHLATNAKTNAIPVAVLTGHHSGEAKGTDSMLGIRARFGNDLNGAALMSRIAQLFT